MKRTAGISEAGNEAQPVEDTEAQPVEGMPDGALPALLVPGGSCSDLCRSRRPLLDEAAIAPAGLPPVEKQHSPRAKARS